MNSKCPSLTDMLLSLLSRGDTDFDGVLRKQINCLSEDLVQRLLRFVLKRGALSQRLARVFSECKHPSVSTWVKDSVDLFAGATFRSPPSFGGNSPKKAGAAEPRDGKTRVKLPRVVTIPTQVPGQVGRKSIPVDLAGHIDAAQASCLNGRPKGAHRAVLLRGGELHSDVDPEMLVTIQFTVPVRLRAVSFQTHRDSLCAAPKSVSIFKNKVISDFSEARDTIPDASFDLKRKACAESIPQQLRAAKFANVDSLTVFVEDNQEGLDETLVNRIAFLGVPLSGGQI